MTRSAPTARRSRTMAWTQQAGGTPPSRSSCSGACFSSAGRKRWGARVTSWVGGRSGPSPAGRIWTADARGMLRGPFGTRSGPSTAPWPGPRLQQPATRCALVCDTVKGRFMATGDMSRLREDAQRAAGDGVDAVIVRTGRLGDPIVLAAGLVDTVRRGLLGAALSVDGVGRHPSVLARD